MLIQPHAPLGPWVGDRWIAEASPAAPDMARGPVEIDAGESVRASAACNDAPADIGDCIAYGPAEFDEAGDGSHHECISSPPSSVPLYSALGPKSAIAEGIVNCSMSQRIMAVALPSLWLASWRMVRVSAE